MERDEGQRRGRVKKKERLLNCARLSGTGKNINTGGRRIGVGAKPRGSSGSGCEDAEQVQKKNPGDGGPGGPSGRAAGAAGGDVVLATYAGAGPA